MLSDKPGNNNSSENSSISSVSPAELNALVARLEAGLEAQQADRAEIANLKTKLAAQEAELQSLRSQLGNKVQSTLSGLAQAKPTSRRGMLRQVGGAAAGLAAVSLAVGLESATAFAGDPAIQADGDSSSYGAQFSGGLAPIRLQPAASAGGRTAGTHAAGEFYVETDGTLWYTPNGTSWQQLGSSFNYLSSPYRVLGTPTTASDPSIPANAIPQLTPSYFQIEGGPIPAEASAILATIVVYGSNLGGFVGLYPGNASGTLPIVSSIAYAGGGAFTSATVSVKLGPLASTGKKGIAALAFTAVKFSLDVIAYTI